MSNLIPVERFTRELFEILDVTFEQHHGIFLDKGISLFETWDGDPGAHCLSPGRNPAGIVYHTIAAYV